MMIHKEEIKIVLLINDSTIYYKDLHNCFFLQQRIRYYTLMVFEDADATLLRLFESFMESAPQLVLQIYILIKDPYANRDVAVQ